MRIIDHKEIQISRIGILPSLNDSRITKVLVEGDEPDNSMDFLHPSKKLVAEIRNSLVMGWNENQTVCLYKATPEQQTAVMEYRKVELARIEKLAESAQSTWSEVDQWLYGAAKGSTPVGSDAGASKDTDWEILSAEVIRELKALWCPKGTWLKPTYLLNWGNRRLSTIPAVNAIRVGLSMGAMLTVSAVIKEYDNELDRVQDNIDENERRNVGAWEPPFAAKIRGAAKMVSLGMIENDIRRRYKDGMGQKLFALAKLNDHHPEVAVIEKVIAKGTFPSCETKVMRDMVRNEAPASMVTEWVETPPKRKPNGLTAVVRQTGIRDGGCIDLTFLDAIASKGDKDKFTEAIANILPKTYLFSEEYSEKLRLYLNETHGYEFHKQDPRPTEG